MSTAVTEPTETQRKRRQILAAGGLLGGIAVVVSAVVLFSGGDPKAKLATAIKAENVHLQDVSRTVNPQESWMASGDVRLKTQDEQLKKLTAQFEQLQQEQAALKTENQTLKDTVALKGPLTPEAQTLGGELAQGKTAGGSTFPSPNFGTAKPPVLNANGQPEVVSQTLNKITIALIPKPNVANSLQEKALHNYLPIGSYVKAIILSGVQASAAVKSQADPLPILFRVTGAAVTANQEQVDLAGCTVTGEAYGDISSERAFVRLHDMTCSKHEGRVIETKVEGYAAALGTGIQGKVISREGALIQSSFWSGLFGGLGQATADASKTVSTSPLGAIETVQPQDMLKNALGKGVASSAERISKYHIERAEQYHAVIEIKAGREVELVFLKGVHLDGRPPENVAATESKAG